MSRFKKLLVFFAVLLVFLGVVSIYQANKSLPENLNLAGKTHRIPAENIRFLKALSFIDASGNSRVEQEIFDEIFNLIKNARHFILVDMFLFNDFLGYDPRTHRNLSGELTELLIKRKENNPDMKIVFITDPINTLYGSHNLQYLEKLSDAGVEVVLTDLRRLRDSNLVYSPLWRTFFQWFGEGDAGFLPNPFNPSGGGWRCVLT